MQQARILIVDDQVTNLVLLQRILQQGGYEHLRTVSDSLQAVGAFREFQPDLVLLDWMMPGLDGLAVLRQLEPLIPADDYLPILVLTADVTYEARRIALSSGAKDFLTKPFDNFEALARVRNLLETRFLHRQLQHHNRTLQAQVLERTRELREQAEIIERVRDALIVLDLQGRIIYWNRGAEGLYGWSSAEAMGQRLLDLLPGVPLNGGTTPEAALTECDDWQGELAQVKKNGGDIAVQSRQSWVYDEGRRKRALFLVNSDITEQRGLEMQLQRAQRLESIGALASGVAHDLNNMLTPIVLGLELVRPIIAEPSAKNVLATMRRSAQRGTDLVRQILTFARGGAEEQRPLTLTPLFKDMAKLLAQTLPRNIEVRLDVAENLAPILADVTQMHQVLLNLSVNARDAMPEGGILFLKAQNQKLFAPDPDVPDSRAGDFAVVTVADTGTGIAPETLARIFEPFFTTKAEGSGTGLGLSTVAKIVQAHRAFVRVRTELGRGTAFDVFLPAMTVGETRPDLPPDKPMHEGQGEWILIVDDEASIREITRSALEVANYHVLTAANGSEALQIYSEHRGRIRVVLLDWSMPIMSGPDAIAALRERDPELPVIVATGSLAEAPEFLTKYRAQGFLAKPFRVETLLNALHEVLKRPE